MFGRKIFKNPNEDNDEGGNSKYHALLQEAKESNLTDVQFNQCVQQGVDNDGHPIMIFLPQVGFGDHEQTEALLRQIFLLFILISDRFISQEFSIMYSHIVPKYNQYTIYEYFKLLSHNAKNNV